MTTYLLPLNGCSSADRRFSPCYGNPWGPLSFESGSRELAMIVNTGHAQIEDVDHKPGTAILSCRPPDRKAMRGVVYYAFVGDAGRLRAILQVRQIQGSVGENVVRDLLNA